MPHSIDVIVGKRLRLRRLQLSLTQAGLGRKIGVAAEQVGRYENGTSRVTCSRLYLISQILEVPIAYFFSGGGEAGGEVAVFEEHHLLER